MTVEQQDIQGSQGSLTVQGRSDGGIWVYTPPKSVQVSFLWGKK